MTSFSCRRTDGYEQTYSWGCVTQAHILYFCQDLVPGGHLVIWAECLLMVETRPSDDAPSSLNGSWRGPAGLHIKPRLLLREGGFLLPYFLCDGWSWKMTENFQRSKKPCCMMVCSGNSLSHHVSVGVRQGEDVRGGRGHFDSDVEELLKEL